MPLGVTRATAFLVMLLTANLLFADDDRIANNLAEAKAKYSSETEAFRETAHGWFDGREEAARRKGDKDTVDRIKEERRKFDEEELLPRSAPSFLKSRQKSARNALLSAYETAIRDYTRASLDGKAAAIQRELQSLQSRNHRPADAVRFGNSYYKVFDSRLTWHDASRECERRGGRLAVVNTPETNAFLTRLAAREKLNVVWLGASDEAEEGKWVWEDGAPLKFSNWEKGQPNNVEKVEHFLVLISSRNGVWWDYPNAPKAYPGFTKQGEPGFICEWE